MSSPRISPAALCRDASQIDIFCGDTDGANWIARYLDEVCRHNSLVGDQIVRILISDSVRKKFDKMVARGLPAEHLARFQEDWKHFLSVVKGWRECEVRRASFDHESTWLVLDRKDALVSSVVSLEYPEQTEAGVVDARGLLTSVAGPLSSVLASFFDRIWNPQVSVLYEHLIQSLLEPAEQTLLDGRGTYWEDLIDRLAADPNRLYGLDPREFEQLVMELLSRDGFDCHLTPASHDGGYDILARFRTPASSVVYLVECKRFAAQKPVGVSIVRALFGVVESQSANVGLIVTTSHLSREARNLKAELHYRMESREYDDLVAWLKKHSSRPSQTTET